MGRSLRRIYNDHRHQHHYERRFSTTCYRHHTSSQAYPRRGRRGHQHGCLVRYCNFLNSLYPSILTGEEHQSGSDGIKESVINNGILIMLALYWRSSSFCGCGYRLPHWQRRRESGANHTEDIYFARFYRPTLYSSLVLKQSPATFDSHLLPSCFYNIFKAYLPQSDIIDIHDLVGVIINTHLYWYSFLCSTDYKLTSHHQH